jgi:hypothetical protein
MKLAFDRRTYHSPVSRYEDDYYMPKSLNEILNESSTTAHRQWVKESSNEQLDEYISVLNANENLHRLAMAERSGRQFKELSKPHWTITPGFIIGVLAMVFAGIAAWPVIRDWLPTSSPAHKDANFQQPQSNSMPAIGIASRTNSAAIYAEPKTNLLKK